MPKSTFLILLFCFLLYGVIGYSQARKYSNEFMNIGVGARGIALSKAQTASVGDVTAGYWNPAGLTQIESDFEVAFMHSEYFAGISKYDYFSFAKPIDDKSAFGISYIRFGVDDIPNTINLVDANGGINYDRISSFSAVDNGFLLSYARNLSIEGLTFGANAKIIRRIVGDFASAWGYGIDAGLQYRVKGWQFGFVAKDLSTTVNAWSFNLSDDMVRVFQLTNNDIPKNGTELTLPTANLGAARYIQVKKRFGVLAETNFEATFGGQRNTFISSQSINIDPQIGAEIDFAKIIFVRFGINNIQTEKAAVGIHQETTFQPNFGVGIKHRGISLDYALTDLGDQSAGLYSNIFSIKLDITKKE